MDFDGPNPRKRLYIILAVLAVILIIAGLSARPAYHWFKQWRALQFVEASANALKAKDLATASQKADAAMQLWPFDVRVIRQEAIVRSQINPAEALFFWQRTWEISRDVGDLRQFVETALNAANFPLAVQEFTELQKLEPNDPATWILEAKIRFSQNNVPEALAILQKVIASGKAPDDARLLYAQASQYSADPVVRGENLDYLRSLATRTDDFGLRALRILLTYANLPRSDWNSVAQKLQKHPLATRDDKLAALHLEAMMPETDEATLLKTARDLFPNNDADALVELGHWLSSQHKYDDVLSLIDETSALKRQDLFLIRIDAMNAQHQWTALDDLLNRPKLPIPDEIRLLFQARVLTELGRSESADLAWQRISNAVADQPAKLRDVALYAVQIGEDDVARPALQQLVKNPDQRRLALQELVQLEHRAHNLPAMHDVLTQMAGYFPSDIVVQNDLLYTGFLLDNAGPEQIAAAQRLVAQDPHTLSYRMTLALGQLKASHPAAALQVFSDVADSTWPTSYNHWNAVYVGVMRANAQADKAAKVASIINVADLLPEEQKLLQAPIPALPPTQ